MDVLKYADRLVSAYKKIVSGITARGIDNQMLVLTVLLLLLGVSFLICLICYVVTSRKIKKAKHAKINLQRD